MSEIDQREFRNACGCFATGITVVTSQFDEQVHGMTANAFMSVSLDPPLILVSVGNNSRMHKVLVNSDRYAVSVLGDDQQDVSNHFAGQPGDAEIEFDKRKGYPVIANAMAYFVTRIVEAHLAGDHTLYVGEVEYFEYEPRDPVLYYRGQYRSLKSPAAE